MFEDLKAPEADKILRLMAMFAADPRPGKVDLGVGVYRDPQGQTPVMEAVRRAETIIAARQRTKSYVGLAGDPAFADALRRLILGDAVPAERVATCATPGGTGAVRQALEMVQRITPDATIWVPTPTWVNHHAIIDHLGQKSRAYRYYDAADGTLDREGMLADLAQARAGDIVLLHGCCHNPTGADLQPDDWRAVGDVLEQTGAIPFIDIAYLGFADGLEADAFGTRHLAERLSEVLIAASCSKNFGLYRERVGLCMAITSGPGPRAAAAGLMAHLNRQSYAFPPDHGARVVQVILDDRELRGMWEDELSLMRETMNTNRAAFAEALRAETGSDRFGFLAGQRGMFSLIGATPAQVETLREDHGIYVVGDGRLNVAGLTKDTIPGVARAVARVLG
ncbi:aromatic amino acid transaminase [Gymnodinialimonas ceratoperidinii]|uniref:Aspartate/tyrosine/aromatic aminotransferase n=1 Tax=Gymnodinialimonas ceratoperidinii TaxID=2856823 RepID=A0A8F6YD74_9RHOB|nr:amino acid aminotransferase [Gymnodinialimonas ceratoperidinii]QXT39907.1 aspartate/tyrosine/aromatic aminotransferase [Gymnodinialimonas ceratoperidinii]